MTNLTPTAELKVVDGMILSIEQTIAEFSDAYTRSELYRELSTYHARKATLQVKLEDEAPAAVLDGISAELIPAHNGTDVFEAVETPIEAVAHHDESTVSIDDDPDLPVVPPSFYEHVNADSDEADEDDFNSEGAELGTAGAPPAAYNVDLVPEGTSTFDQTGLDAVPEVSTVPDEDDDEFNRIVSESEDSDESEESTKS